MIGRAVFSSRLTRAWASVLGTLACAALAPALSATPALAAEPCPNEGLRRESNANPATGQPYSAELPECRAYEMVSPPYKQSHGAGSASGGFPVAPDGETVGFDSEGSFAGAENYRINFPNPSNVYLARRGGSGWSTTSAFAPRSLVEGPSLRGLDSDFSPDLRSVQVSCGFASPVLGEQKGVGVACAKREADGPWVSTPLHMGVDASSQVEIAGYIGASSDFSRVFLQPLNLRLLPEDTSTNNGGIYELQGMGTSQETLRLVNVDNEGKELLIGGSGAELTPGGPMLGYAATKPPPEGSAYHAISANGQTVFFTAAPTAEAIPTLYARVDNGQEDAHTVTVSAPEGVTSEQKPAVFQGASADGSKVFFTTTQKLLSGDTDSTNDLYEYDFNPPPGQPHLVQISAGEANPEHPTKGAGAKVRGVLRSSPDGSHVYFVAAGVLTTEKNKEGEGAIAGQDNLYGYDTLTNKTKFVATLATKDAELWGGAFTVGSLASTDNGSREVQTTPDGRYLVFSSAAQLAGDTNTGAAYRYDFETGELTWISHAAPSFQNPNGNEGQPVLIAGLLASQIGANVNVDDWSRAISENGEYVVFTTSEKLQETAPEGLTSVYLWHNGTVSMIAAGARSPAMSSSGSDIFFETPTRLVAQDTDVLSDVYDARVGGGFPAPPAEPSCAGDACQGSPEPLPSFAPSASSFTPAGGNIPPPTPPPPPPHPTRLTEEQQLAKALAACKSKPKKQRPACELQARKRYGAQQLAKVLKACKHEPKNKRHACESQARKRYGR